MASVVMGRVGSGRIGFATRENCDPDLEGGSWPGLGRVGVATLGRANNIQIYTVRTLYDIETCYNHPLRLCSLSEVLGSSSGARSQ